MLITLTAPLPKLANGMHGEGMVYGSAAVEPGRPPPWIIPHCFECRVPVERFTVDWIASPFYLPIQFSCHGRTGGLKVPYNEVLKASKGEGGQLWVFTEKMINARRTAHR